MNAITKLTPMESKSGRKETHTHGKQEWEERNMSNHLCDLEQACRHPYDHERLWNPFDTEVTVSIWLYLGQRELHNAYESVNTDATLIGSIQGQYTETGTLHSWAVYRDSIQRPRQLIHSNESAVYVDCIQGPKDTRFYFKRELAVYRDSIWGQHARHIFCTQ